MRNIFLAILFLIQTITPAFAGTQAIVKANIVEGQDYTPNFLVEKGHYEKNANGTLAYADAAGTRPVDGVGGSPVLTCTRTTTGPISGDGSLLITKDAANRQGNGCGIAFSVDLSARAKVLQIEFDYIVKSGTFVAGTDTTDSDLIVYMYDNTNATLIEPSSIKLLSNSSTLTNHFVANFQTSATGTSYNLIIHQATTSAAAFTVALDNFEVKPSKYVYGTPITDWVSYTSTLTNFTVSSQKFYYRRVGDSMEVTGLMVLNAAPSSTLYWTMPSGFTIDSAKIDLTSNDGNYGTANIVRSVTANYQGAVQVGNSAGRFRIVNSGGGNEWNATVPLTFASGDRISVQASFPITGWSSSVQQSDSYSSREIGIVVSNPTSAVTSSLTDITTWGTVTKDFTGSFNATTGVFTVPSQGMYKFSGSFLIAATLSAADKFAEVDLMVDGVAVRSNQTRATINNTNIGLPFSFEYPLNAGQLVKLQISCNGSSTSFNAGSPWNYFQISKNQAPTTISATELIAAGYSLSANKTPAINAAIDFDSKLYDTHNAVTTGGSGVWKFTAPASGIYEVNMTGAITSGAQTVDLYKNGVQGKVLMSVNSTAVASGSASVLLNAGDYISANPDGSVTFSSTKNTNIYIKRLK